MRRRTTSTARGRGRAYPSEEGSGSLVATALFQKDDSEFFVWVIDPELQVVSRRAIEIDRSTGLGVTVFSGLEDGERIAASQIHELSEGRRVIPIGN